MLFIIIMQIIFISVYVFQLEMVVERLNGVVSLFTEFKVLFHFTSPFWSRDKANPGIPHTYEQDFRT